MDVKDGNGSIALEAMPSFGGTAAVRGVLDRLAPVPAGQPQQGGGRLAGAIGCGDPNRPA